MMDEAMLNEILAGVAAAEENWDEEMAVGGADDAFVDPVPYAAVAPALEVRAFDAYSEALKVLVRAASLKVQLVSSSALLLVRPQVCYSSYLAVVAVARVAPGNSYCIPSL